MLKADPYEGRLFCFSVFGGFLRFRVAACGSPTAEGNSHASTKCGSKNRAGRSLRPAEARNSFSLVRDLRRLLPEYLNNIRTLRGQRSTYIFNYGRNDFVIRDSSHFPFGKMWNDGGGVYGVRRCAASPTAAGQNEPRELQSARKGAAANCATLTSRNNS